MDKILRDEPIELGRRPRRRILIGRKASIICATVIGGAAIAAAAISPDITWQDVADVVSIVLVLVGG